MSCECLRLSVLESNVPGRSEDMTRVAVLELDHLALDLHLTYTRRRSVLIDVGSVDALSCSDAF